MKHSPGPWMQDKSCVGRTIVANAPDGMAFNLAHLAGDDPVQEANARLIAAAPDLLEAAKVALEYWKNSIPAYAFLPLHAASAMEFVTKVIAEAEGGE